MGTNMYANYGLGVVKIDDPVSNCVERLERIFVSPNVQLPTLPKAALEVLRLSHNPQVNATEILSVLETDATLAARLLARARSPVYGIRPVASLREASVRMGINGLRDLVLQISMRMTVFRAPGFEPQVNELMRFAQVRSNLCHAINDHSRIPQTQASMCALLADLGMATALMLLAQVPRGQTSPPLATAWEAARESQERIGAQVAKSWGLPGEIVWVIRNQHHLHIANVANPTIGTLLVASVVAEHLNIGLRGPDGVQFREQKSEVNGARRLLGLNTDKMKRIVARARLMELDAIN
ncbi:MAG: HD-like signal output (HDOD) protein [Cognaticolwellia sp.]|jgi:HD-like signal output (HDOD) protein